MVYQLCPFDVVNVLHGTRVVMVLVMMSVLVVVIAPEVVMAVVIGGDT